MPSKSLESQEDRTFRVLRALHDSPSLSQRELASRAGVSLGALNYCLRALTEKGLVKVKNFAGSQNKFGYVYLLTPEGIREKAALTGDFFQRKLREYEALKQEIESLRVDSDLKKD